MFSSWLGTYRNFDCLFYNEALSLHSRRIYSVDKDMQAWIYRGSPAAMAIRVNTFEIFLFMLSVVSWVYLKFMIFNEVRNFRTMTAWIYIYRKQFYVMVLPNFLWGFASIIARIVFWVARRGVRRTILYGVLKMF